MTEKRSCEVEAPIVLPPVFRASPLFGRFLVGNRYVTMRQIEDFYVDLSREIDAMAEKVAGWAAERGEGK